MTTQTLGFFKSEEEMGIAHVTVLQLQSEDILSVTDLTSFTADHFKTLADSLRRPSGRISDLTGGALAGVTIPTLAFTFGVWSQSRLTVA